MAGARELIILVRGRGYSKLPFLHMSSDVGPAAVAGGREQLDIRMKLLTEKLRQER